MPGDIILWRELKALLEQRTDAALAELDKAEGDRAVGKAQGRLAAYREMKHLPETLQMLAVKPEGKG